MDDEGIEVEVIDVGEMNIAVAAVLQVIEEGMVQDDEDQQRDLQLPVLIGDQDGAGDEGKEVHLEQAMHLVDELRHEQADYYAQHILVEIRIRQEQLHGIVG